MSDKGRWYSEERELFLKRMSSPFIFKDTQSKRSFASTKREMSRETLLNRLRPQVVEMITQGLPYDTPEEWDEGFYQLGGGQGRRKSSIILSRMTWEKFLEFIEEIRTNLN